jgi:hypothetical protein
MSTNDHTDDRAVDELGDDELPEVIHVAEDLSEYLEKKRYDAIFEAKQEAAEILRRTGTASTAVQTNADLRYIRERVSERIVGYITEVRRILEETDAGQELWQDTHIATTPLSEAALTDGDVRRVVAADGLEPVEHTPQRQQTRTTNDGHRYRLTAAGEFVPIDDSKQFETTHATNSSYYYVLGGVADYLTLHSTTVTVEHLTDAPGRGRGQQIEQAAVDPYPTIPTSREVYQQLTQLLGDTGLDLEVGEPEKDEWELSHG